MAEKQTVNLELLQSGPGRFPQSPNGRLPEIPPVTDARVQAAAAQIAREYLGLLDGKRPVRIGDFVELL